MNVLCLRAPSTVSRKRRRGAAASARGEDSAVASNPTPDSLCGGLPVSHRWATRALARLGADEPERCGGRVRVLEAESWSSGAGHTSSRDRGHSARGGSGPRSGGPRFETTRPSKPTPASVLAQVTRHPPGLRPPAQLLDALVFQDRPSIDGVLQTFMRRLEMLDPRLDRLQSLLPTALRTDRRPRLRLDHSRLTRPAIVRCVFTAQNLPTL
jgi:hypothetical protein